jgi:Universal stress protein family
MIVLGTRGRSGLSAEILGGVSHAVRAKAHCPSPPCRPPRRHAGRSDVRRNRARRRAGLTTVDGFPVRGSGRKLTPVGLISVRRSAARWSCENQPRAARTIASGLDIESRRRSAIPGGGLRVDRQLSVLTGGSRSATRIRRRERIPRVRRSPPSRQRGARRPGPATRTVA